MKIVILSLLIIISTGCFGQEVAILLKEASNLEKALKDNESLDKYKEVLKADPTNLIALIKSGEIASGIGGRLSDKKQKNEWYNVAKDYIERALLVDSNSAEANYVRALLAGKYGEIESENKKLAGYLKEMNKYADRALALNADNGKANFIKGKWHYDMLLLPWAKKTALKVFFGGMPDGNIDSVYKYFEKCRVLEPYFVPNFYFLAKAYRSDDKPAKAIEVLNQLVKLPLRTSDDSALKAEGKVMLNEMQ